jgi:hypothetical protein
MKRRNAVTEIDDVEICMDCGHVCHCEDIVCFECQDEAYCDPKEGEIDEELICHQCLHS